MQKYFSLAITILIAALILFGQVNNCRAYVIGGSHLLDLMVRNLGSAKTLLVSQEVCIFDAEDEPDAHSTSDEDKPDHAAYQEVIKYSFPDHFRSDVETSHGVKIHLSSVNRYLTVINEEITSTTQPLSARYKDILLIRERTLLENHLTDLGMDTSISSLGRYNGKIHYVIGAKAPDESRPQLWIDQKTFRPTRYITNDLSNPYTSHRFEIIYLDWKRFGKTWYPGRIEIFNGGKIMQTIDTQSVDVNPALTEDIFDIDKAELLYKKSMDTEIRTEDEHNDLHNVHQSIEEFRERFE